MSMVRIVLWTKRHLCAHSPDYLVEYRRHFAEVLRRKQWVEHLSLPAMLVSCGRVQLSAVTVAQCDYYVVKLTQRRQKSWAQKCHEGPVSRYVSTPDLPHD